MTIIAESTNAADAKEKAKAWLGAHPEFSERDLVLDVIRAEGGNVYRYRLIGSAAADNTQVAILGRVFEVEMSDLSPAVAEAWLKLRLPKADEERLRELSARSKKGELNSADAELLENYLTSADSST